MRDSGSGVVLSKKNRSLETAKLFDYYKEGNTSFIPLFFIAYHLFHKNISNNDLLNYWDDYETSNVDYKPMCKWL